MFLVWLVRAALLSASGRPAAAAAGQTLNVAPPCRVGGLPQVALTLHCGDGRTAGVLQYWHTPLGQLEQQDCLRDLDPVFVLHNGSLQISNSSRLHGGLYYCLLQHTEGTTLWPYQLHIGAQEGGGRGAAGSRGGLGSEEGRQAEVSDGAFAGAVAASVLLTFVVGFSAGALSRTEVLRCAQAIRRSLQSPRQRQSDEPDRGTAVSTVTVPPVHHNQAMEMVQVGTLPPPAKPQRSFRHKREEQTAVYLEGCDQDTGEGRRVQTEEGRRVQTQEGRRVQTEEGRRDQTEEGRRVQTEEGRRVQTKEGRRDQTQEGRRDQTQEGRRVQTQEGRRVQTQEGRRVQTEEGRRDQTQEGRRDQTQEVRGDQTEEGRRVQTEEGRGDQTEEGRRVQTQEGRRDQTEEGRRDQTQEGRRDQTEEGRRDQTEEVRGDQTQEGRRDQTEEGRRDQTQEGRRDQTQEGRRDQTQEGRRVQTQEGRRDQTQEVRGDQTQEVRGDQTQEGRRDQTQEVRGDQTQEGRGLHLLGADGGRPSDTDREQDRRENEEKGEEHETSLSLFEGGGNERKRVGDREQEEEQEEEQGEQQEEQEEQEEEEQEEEQGEEQGEEQEEEQQEGSSLFPGGGSHSDGRKEEEEESDLSSESGAQQEQTVNNDITAPQPGRRVIRLYQYDEDGRRFGHLPDPAHEEAVPAPRLKQRSLSLTRLNAIMAAAAASPLEKGESHFHMEI